MIARDYRFQRTAGTTRLEALIECKSAVKPSFEIRFDVDVELEEPEAVGDVLLAATLIPAMFAGEPLEIHAPVTHRLRRTSREVQRILHCWYPNLLSEIDVILPRIVPPASSTPEGPAACFFSGGVDSWFTFTRNRNDISTLITVKGFDLPFSEQKIWADLSKSTSEIASENSVKRLRVETNIRDFLDPGNGCFYRKYEGDDFWGECYHGACLNSVGLLLQKRFSRVYVPASWHYSRLHHWGSHPLLDCLWSNGRTEFIHDGADATRLGKIRAISMQDHILKHLRVCPVYHAGSYNCGKCEKCRRTMLAFALMGVDASRLRFDSQLDLEEMQMNPPPKVLRPLYREILEEASKKGDPQLINCLRVLCGERSCVGYEWRRWTSRMRRSISKRAAFFRGK